MIASLMSAMITNITPIVKLESAILKIGKSYPNIFVSIKSTTLPCNTRSIKFPKAPASIGQSGGRQPTS